MYAEVEQLHGPRGADQVKSAMARQVERRRRAEQSHREQPRDEIVRTAHQQDQTQHQIEETEQVIQDDRLDRHTGHGRHDLQIDGAAGDSSQRTMP